MKNRVGRVGVKINKIWRISHVHIDDVMLQQGLLQKQILDEPPSSSKIHLINIKWNFTKNSTAENWFEEFILDNPKNNKNYSKAILLQGSN